jgi:hypothetical protein
VVTTTSAATFDTQLPAKKPSLLKAKRVQPLKIDATTTFSIIPKAAQEEKVG